VGAQVAVVGSVNAEAIYEATTGESLEDLLRFAGGPNSLGDQSRLILYRSSDMDRIGPQQVARQSASTLPALGGDILQVLSRGTLVQPIDRQSVLVRLEGEVNRPGNYYVAPNTPLTDVLAQAGGLTPRAFAFGTKLQRASVRAQQRESYAEAIKQLELTLAASPLTADQSQSVGERQTQLAGAREVLERLKTAEPDGRVVLNISPAAMNLPADVLLENNDQIYVPPRATTVGVFGAVYRPASFHIDTGQPLRVRDYVYRAGGTLRAADQKGIFVVRANGEVLPQRRGAMSARVLPGDVIFVPVRSQSTSFWAKLRDLSTTLFQVGVGAATGGALAK
jgi:protein involved in polysaccharide export with SLBB domain